MEQLAAKPRSSSGWIQTYTGHQFWPADPRPEDFCELHIAHALSMICRYTGHTKHFYSVAQHSVLASMYCQDEKWGLMHDAAEAYLADVARPVKPFLRGYEELEAKILRAMSEWLSLPWPIPSSVKEVDLRLLATERRDVMLPSQHRWILVEQVEPYEQRITPHSPAEAETDWLRSFRRLFHHSQSPKVVDG